MPQILVVEPDASDRERLLGWLEEDGFDATGCPGPCGPEYTCPAGMLVHCPLAADADVIVLNLWLKSDTVLAGTPGSTVLLYYLSLDKPVVLLTDGSDGLIPAAQAGIAVLGRSPERAEMVTAVRGLLNTSRWPRDPQAPVGKGRASREDGDDGPWPPARPRARLSLVPRNR
jgi:hypothetical protein